MPLILPGNVASALGGPYEVANSCRFDRGSSASMHITFSSAGDRQKFTFSFWIKRNKLGTQEVIFDTNFGGGANEHRILFDSSDRLEYYDYASSSTTLKYVTNRVFRDISAWYHIVIAVDTTQGTAGNRVKIYINGTQETSFGTETQPSENLSTSLNTAVKHQIGTKNVGANYLEAYLAEFVFIDGTQYANTDFGEFDSDSPRIWKPKDPLGLTFGTNGFYLDFEDSSNLGNDANGGTDLTEVNLAAGDQSSDSPTNNFCVMNILDNYIPASTFSEGNCVITTPSSNYQYNTGTFGLTAGKWYFEMKMTTNATGDFVGIAGRVCGGALHMAGYYNDTWAYSSYDGKYFTNNTGSSYGDSWATDNTIIGVYIDLDNNKLYFAKNGTVQNSGTGISITDPASVTNGAYHPSVGDNWNGDSGTYHMNFGNPTYALSSAQSDKNGYGQFEYDPSSGTFDGSSKDFLAICTKNLGSDGG